MAREVIIDSNVDQYSAQVEEALGRALRDAGDQVARDARSANKRGYRIDGIVSDVGVTGASRRRYRGKDGIEVAVIWRDFRAIFFEKGTRANRRGKLSKRTRRKTAADRGGVRAIRFMRTGLKSVKETLLDDIRRELRR